MARKNEAKFFVTLDTKQYTFAFKKLTAGNANYVKQLKLMQQQEARYRQSQKALGASLTDLARKTNVIAKGYQHFGATLSNNNRIVSTAISGYKNFQLSQQRIATSLGQSTKAIRTQTAALQQQKLAYAGMSGAGRAAALPPVEGPTKPFGKATPILPPVAPRQTYEYERIKTATREAANAQKGLAKGISGVNAVSKTTTATLRGMGATLVNMARLLKAFAIVIAAQKLFEFAENAGQLNNRLRVVSDSAEELTENFERMRDIAKKTRTPIKDATVLFVRMRIATKRLGYDIDDVAQATENLSKMMKVQGVSMHESRSAMLQLSQALQSGRLQGDEFRAIQEIMPALLGDIAQATGYPIEALKDLASEGKITPKVIMDALLENTEKIDLMFSRTKMTVGDLGTAVKNSFTTMFSELQRNQGGAANLARAYELVADSFEVVAEALGLIITALTFLASLFPSTENDLKKLEESNSELHKSFKESGAEAGFFTKALQAMGVEVNNEAGFLETLSSGFRALRNSMLSSMEVAELEKQRRQEAIDAAAASGITLSPAQLKLETEELIKAVEAQQAALTKYRSAWDNLKTGISLDDTVDNMKRLGEEFKATAFKTLVEDFPQGFGNAVADTIMDGKSLKDSLGSMFKQMAKQVIAQIVAMITQMLIMKAIMASLGFGGMAFGTGFAGQGLSGLFGGLGKGIGSIAKGISGLFADGGRPPVGQAAIVGERGPELFVPDTPGTIIPNDQMGGTVVIQRLEIMPGANIDQALMDKPATYWVDLAQEKILPALNTLGQAGNTTTLKQRESR